ncbi:MAG: hypothetical protein CMO55_15950 [Verrucomicrobiales bacterium]|nr:hypothetical protein [Verrucomicrobiales bacterium]
MLENIRGVPLLSIFREERGVKIFRFIRHSFSPRKWPSKPSKLGKKGSIEGFEGFEGFEGGGKDQKGVFLAGDFDFR